jgi:hypothetical protein
MEQTMTAGGSSTTTASVSGRRSLVKVGFYEVERTIGKGNYALVKLGRHRVTKTEARNIGS